MATAASRIDRFGRLEHVRWHRISDPASWVEKLIFGYDKADDRLWRVNTLKTDTEDELYSFHEKVCQIKPKFISQ